MKTAINNPLSKAMILWLLLVTCTMTISGCKTATNTLFGNPAHYPEYIEQVQPEPGTEISLGDVSEWSWIGRNVGDICVEILEQPLLRPKDDLYQFDNIRLQLDSEDVKSVPSHEPSDIPIEGLVDDSGNVIATGTFSDTVCWNTDLSLGIHEAVVVVWTSTGQEFSYRWAFKVVE